MRILFVNPNTSPGLTELLVEAAQGAAAAGTEVVGATAAWGVPYIASRAEAALGAVAALEILAERHAGFDAAVVAAFGDPGLLPARELFPLPVVGLAEAGMLTACMLGARFGIVTFSPTLVAWYRECVATHGLSGRCAGVFAAPPGGFSAIEGVRDEMAEGLVALAAEAVAGGADVVVLAGAPLSGLARRVRERIAVPVVDCAAAAAKQAEALVALRLRRATAGSFARPPGKKTVGVAGPLARWIEG